MDSINFWTNVSGTFSTIVFSFVFFLLFPFLAWCGYWCFIHHSLQQKNSALLLLVTPGEIWRKEKEIIQIPDTISSLPSHILPCSQLGLSYTICTAISHCCKNILLTRNMLQVLKKIIHINILINILFSIKIFSVFFPRTQYILFCFCYYHKASNKVLFQFATNFDWIHSALNVACLVLHYGKTKTRNTDKIINSKWLRLIETALMLMHVI